jgi:Rieske Fe-S protein
MTRRFRLRPVPGAEEELGESPKLIDRREFMRHSFNTAAGVITMASLGAVGFASLLMGQSSADGGDTSVRFWVPSGAEDTVWYGDEHLEPMSFQSFVDAAASSSTGMSGASGVWSGLPVNVMYVPHTENAQAALVENKPRFQFLDGYNESGAYIGSGYEVDEDSAYELLSIHDNMIIIFSRCPHLCCIPGWQLVANDFTSDQWFPGGVDAGGNKLFCICHSSRYDPTVIEKNRNRNRTDGTEFDYIGIRRTGGPAPVGMPLIPFVVNGVGIIEALDDFKDWYTYCA